MPGLVPVVSCNICAVFDRNIVGFPPGRKCNSSFFKFDGVDIRIELFGKGDEAISNLLHSPLQHNLDSIHVNLRQ
jgi:hypothetical protein